MKYFLLYILLINLYGLFLMYTDKKHAIKHQWRTPELKLFLVAFLLGSLGIYLGMYLFRHKTKHKKFILFIPIIIFAQLYILYRLSPMLNVILVK